MIDPAEHLSESELRLIDRALSTLVSDYESGRTDEDPDIAASRALRSKLLAVKGIPDEIAKLIEEDSTRVLDDEEPIHTWFGLTYSSYLVLPRSALQTMPTEWQRRLVALLEESRAYLDTDDMPEDYQVRAKKNGKYIQDPYSDYWRGRTRVKLRNP